MGSRRHHHRFSGCVDAPTRFYERFVNAELFGGLVKEFAAVMCPLTRFELGGCWRFLRSEIDEFVSRTNLNSLDGIPIQKVKCKNHLSGTNVRCGEIVEIRTNGKILFLRSNLGIWHRREIDRLKNLVAVCPKCGGSIFWHNSEGRKKSWKNF